MTQVFNAISDAILVVQDKQKKDSKAGESDEEIIGDPKCLFVNRKSLEIFGDDLMNTVLRKNNANVNDFSSTLNMR